MSVKELGNDKTAETFLASSGFDSLLLAMSIINDTTSSEVVGVLANVAMGNYLLNWAKSGRSGYSMSIVNESDVRIVDGNSASRQRGFPQLNLQGGRMVQQITIVTGENSLSEFQFPAHNVVENSSRTIAARLERVQKGFAGVRNDLVDSVFIQVQRGGGIRYNERLYKGSWTYRADLSSILERRVNHSDLLVAMGSVS